MNSVLSKNKIIYRAVLLVVLFLAIFFLLRISPTLIKPENISADDYIRFWASGRLNLHGLNPYDPQAIEQLQIGVGDLLSGQNSITLNPPWTVSFLIPFGFLNYPISRVIWMLISIVVILISTLMLWRVYSGDSKKRWLAILAAFLFAPTISALEKGQITGLVLLGISGFLYFIVIDHQDWFAGAFLVLASVKPQMIIVFWIAVLFWIVHERRWKVFIAALFTVTLLTVMALIFNPRIVNQYLAMLQNNKISDWAVPTIGSYLRFFWFGLDRFWVQFLPTLVGVIWFLIYWQKHCTSWNWAVEMPIILIVSMLTSPYFWTYDVVILIPAILAAVVYIIRDWKSLLSLSLLLVYITVNALDLGLHVRLDDFWFVWLVPVLAGLYFFVQVKYPIEPRNPIPSPE